MGLFSHRCPSCNGTLVQHGMFEGDYTCPNCNRQARHHSETIKAIEDASIMPSPAEPVNKISVCLTEVSTHEYGRNHLGHPGMVSRMVPEEIGEIFIFVNDVTEVKRAPFDKYTIVHLDGGGSARVTETVSEVSDIMNEAILSHKR